MDETRPDDPTSDSDDRLIEAAHRQVFDEGDDPPLPTGAVTETLRDAPTAAPKRIGQYHIKRVIASGGMGTVYEAVQERPRRTVALKLMKQGIASRSALRRFEYESQILARLRHPGIAQVHEAGTHQDDSGTIPYFAMEYIPNALPITKYAREKKLGTRQRMELFSQVCDAVHHGHQKGIIHRDLKPSNILVDSSGQVKIIDFGVARSTDSDLAVTTLQTDVGQLVGTLQYMSPEQCAADPHDIDTRSDVYALGVVFYELLCERLPYDVSRRMIHEATRVIREEPPTRLSTINRKLRGDVETIALKALEKERERRYQSATDFGQDIRRYLSNEAIAARPPSVVYQLRVLVRRNKPIFAAIAAVIVVLAGATTYSASMYFRSEANRLKAEKEADKANASLAFVTKMIGAASPGGRVDLEQITVRSLLDDATARLDDGELADFPEVEADLRWWLGETYRHSGVGEPARGHLARSFELRRELFGEEDDRTLWAAHKLSIMLPPEESERVARKNVEILTRTRGPAQRFTLRAQNVLGWALSRQGRIDEAEAVFRDCIQVYQDHPELKDDSSYGFCENNLVDMYLRCCRDDDAKLDEVESLIRSVLGPNPMQFQRELLDTLGMVLNIRGKFEEAEPILRENFEARQRVLEPNNHNYAETWTRLATSLFGQGEVEEGRALVAEQLALLGTDVEPDVPPYLHGLARQLVACERENLCDPEVALTLAHKGLELSEEPTENSVNTYVDACLGAGREEQLDFIRPYVRQLMRSKQEEAEAPDANANAHNVYAWYLLTCKPEDMQDPHNALPYAQRAVQLSEGKKPAILDTLALAYFRTGDTARAIETQEKAVSLVSPEQPPLRKELEANLARFRAALAGHDDGREGQEPDAGAPP